MLEQCHIQFVKAKVGVCVEAYQIFMSYKTWMLIVTLFVVQIDFDTNVNFVTPGLQQQPPGK